VNVTDASQGKGIGGALCAVMKAACAEMGAKEVRVCPGGYDGNTKRQMRFYQSNVFDFGDDEEMMTWRPRNAR
jgi:GNAT superfamily N-acetyltransferase